MCACIGAKTSELPRTRQGAAVRPRFAVVLPAYDAAGTIADAIGSVLAQDYPSWQMVVVDDGSSDDTERVAREAASGDPRITVTRQDNCGAAAARLAAMRHVRAEWICRLDADDVYLPGYFARYARAIDEMPGYDIYCANGVRETADGVREPIHTGRAFLSDREISRAEMLERNVVFGMNVYRADLHRLAGLAPRAYTEDYELWMRAILGGARIWYVADTLSVYRTGAANMSADREKMSAGVADVLAVAAADDRLSAEETARASASLERYRAHARRAAFERDLVAGKLTDARRRFLSARLGYRRPLRRWAAGALVMVSPRLLRRHLMMRGDAA